MIKSNIIIIKFTLIIKFTYIYFPPNFIILFLIHKLLIMSEDIEYDVKELIILIKLKDENNSLLRACELEIK